MRLNVRVNSGAHGELVPSVTWTPDQELLSVGDDHAVKKWQSDGSNAGEVTSLDGYATCIRYFPATAHHAVDIFAVSGSDGTLRLMTRAGREETPRVKAHEAGAVICVAWNYDGSALATGGEDGCLKIWSSSGYLRTTLVQTGKPMYAISWGPDNEAVLLSAGKELIIKSLQVGQKPLRWAAHEGVVTCADWNAVNTLIVSGGEDRLYRVWDAFGRQLYSSSPNQHVITSVRWSPKGNTFAVGSFDMLRLCDKTGWSYCRERPRTGSLLDIQWTKDGTQLAAATGSGSVVFAEVLDQIVEWNGIQAVLVEPRRISVVDITSDQMEEYLDFPRDRVVTFALGYDHLVAATATQCLIYKVGNWNTPQICDLRAPPTLVLLSSKSFLLVDSGANGNGIQVMNYEGRQLSNPRFQGLQCDLLNSSTIGLAQDAVCVIDGSDPKVLRCFDALSGRLIPGSITHTTAIVSVAVSQFAQGIERRMVTFIDRNRDLWLCLVAGGSAGKGRGRRGDDAEDATNSTQNQERCFKLHTQVDTMAWGDTSDTLCAIADGRLVSWYYPMAAFVTRDLLPRTRKVTPCPEMGKHPTIASFQDAHLSVRRADGAILNVGTLCGPPLLYEFVEEQRWEEAVRLCRFVKEDEMWAALASMAIKARHLETAETALAAIHEVDKLEYVLYIKEVPSEEGRNAELALLMRKPADAENILLQASPPLIYRAIMMNINLFRWERALELAVRHKSHVDTVLGHRQKFLKRFDREESNSRFLQFSGSVEIDWDAINAKREKELEDEHSRAPRSYK